MDVETLRVGLSHCGKWEEVADSEPIIYAYRALCTNNPITGYLGQWYAGGYSNWKGIKSNEDKLGLAKFWMDTEGVFLMSKSPFGIVVQDKFYDSVSILFNGSFVSYSVRKNNFGKEIEEKSPIPVSDSMPTVILNILNNDKEIVLETARHFKLPLEVIVEI